MRGGAIVKRCAIAALILGGAMGGGATGAAADVPRQVAEGVAAAVVEISARQCAGAPAERIGTGFAFGAAGQVVTAHHVVAGCRQIELWYERTGGQPRRSATVERVLARSDLALLRVGDPPSEAVLKAAGTVDEAAPLKAIGYAVGQPTLGDLDLTISIGSNVLEDMLPPVNRAEISRETAIDLRTRIYRFSKPLYPGMSGGPVFDAEGHVVAVVAGGLKSGAVAASWGWPAGLLDELLRSQDPVTAGTGAAATQFAYATRTRPESQHVIRCGQLSFEQGERLSFTDIAASSDNVERLELTVSFSTRPRDEIEALMFDTWIHRPSGATAVVPADAELRPEGDICVARSTDGIFEQVVWAAPAANEFQINAVSQGFETNIVMPMAIPNIGWYPDQVLSFNGPQYRQDGFVVNRKAIFVGKTLLQPGVVLAIHQFETIMARGGTFVGIATVNNQVEQCQNPYTGIWGLCSADSTDLKRWAHFVLATQMSTYPIY